MVLLGGMGGMMSYALDSNVEAVENPQGTNVEEIPRIFAMPEFDPIPPIDIWVVTQGFNEKTSHFGVDMAAKDTDAPIMAVENGTVVKAGFSKETGNHIIIKHNNGYETKYFHCKQLLVKEGDMVKRGDIIAVVGTTGNSTGPHLHFELHIDGNAVNPTKHVDLNSME